MMRDLDMCFLDKNKNINFHHLPKNIWPTEVVRDRTCSPGNPHYPFLFSCLFSEKFAYFLDLQRIMNATVRKYYNSKGREKISETHR